MPDTTGAVDTILIAMPLRKAASEGDDRGPMPVEGIARDDVQADVRGPSAVGVLPVDSGHG